MIRIVRHGQPEGTEQGKRYLGRTEVPLSGEGQIQADQLGAKLRAETAAAGSGGAVRIISSPQMRCYETARIISRHFPGAAVETDPDLKEIDMGVWDGKLFSKIREAFPEEYEARGRDLWNYRAPGGESFAETGERFRSVIEKRIQPDEEDMIIVSHAGAILSGLSLLTGIPFEDLRRRGIPYAGIVKLKCRKKETGGLIYEIDENGGDCRTGALSRHHADH